MNRIEPSAPAFEGGAISLEVRWIYRGQIPHAALAWVGPFDAWIEQREDRYLVDPAAPELGVKIKGGTELDLKAYRGGLGVLDVPGGGRGRLQRWEKWLFPLSAVALPPADGASWVALWKTRHRRSFRMSGEGLVERPVTEAGLPGCSVEVSGFTVGGEAWWTIPPVRPRFRVAVGECLDIASTLDGEYRSVAARKLVRFIEGYYAERLGNA